MSSLSNPVAAYNTVSLNELIKVFNIAMRPSGEFCNFSPKYAELEQSHIPP